MFLDSGIGGLSYLSEFRRRAEAAAVSYVADTAGFPYGNREPRWVRDRVVRVVAAALDRTEPRVCVIACNTASVVALSRLRERFSIPFVGVVPAVKPASALTTSGRIAVLSTSRTASDPYTDRLVSDFAGGIRVQRIGLPELVTVVESSLCADANADIEAVIRREVIGRIAPDTDTVVLACTHFISARGALQRLLGPTIRIVDSLDGVIRRVLDLARDDAPPSNGSVDRPLLLATGPLPARLACLRSDYEVAHLETDGATRVSP